MNLAKLPTSEAELLANANWLAGFRLGEIAEILQIPVPKDLKRDKGWVGQLIETALGANAGSKAEQDFVHLGIELKTIPINVQGEPLETTFVSLAPLIQNNGITWQSSHVRHIGQPILWQPSSEQEQQLQQDWEELMELIVLGQLHKINATLGEVLQLRPKGRNSKALANAINEQGQPIQSLPLGFYLRNQFTRQILQQFLIAHDKSQ